MFQTPAAGVQVLVSSSAVGFYGVSEKVTFDESSPSGSDFLSRVCQNWEAEANRAETRVVVVRTGIVMATEGGALAKMLPMFDMFLGMLPPAPLLALVARCMHDIHPILLQMSKLALFQTLCIVGNRAAVCGPLLQRLAVHGPERPTSGMHSPEFSVQ